MERVFQPVKVGGRKKMISIELKHEIIQKYEKGVRVSDLARQYGRTTSTISTLLKQKEAIKAIKPANGITLISKLRTSVHEEMERLLMVWIREKQLNKDILTQGIIREKALAIYSDLSKNTPSASSNEASKDAFRASRGWFDNFKKRNGIHSFISQGEAASSYVKAVEDDLKRFSKVIKAKEYVPQQVFNCGKAELFWKRLPKRTSIRAEEKTMPGYKPMNDRLTLVLCANANGDCKIKPLLVYHLENPSTFKSHKILKEKLQVMWRANPHAQVTAQFFIEWVNLVFGPSVKKYLEENNLPMQALLLLDNAPAHPFDLEDNILEEFQFIKVFFLAPNTSTLLQPIDQEVISNFKKLYTKHLFQQCIEVMESTNLTLLEFWKDHFNIVVCLKIINQAWLDVTKRTLISAWKTLWPEAAAESSTDEFEPEVQVELEIVSLGKSLGFEIDENDVAELISQELTTEDLQELQSQQDLEETSIEESEVEIISLREVKDILGMWERVSQFVERKHPEKYVTTYATKLFNETCLTYFRNLLKGSNNLP